MIVAMGQKLSKTLSAADRRQCLAAADEELRTAAERLKASLRAGYPDLFNRRGRLRPTELRGCLAARTGGKFVLSGAELQALEDQADLAARRSVQAIESTRSH
jgi:hypothetical protein